MLIHSRHLKQGDVQVMLERFDEDHDGIITSEGLAKSIELLYKERKTILNERKSRTL